MTLKYEILKRLVKAANIKKRWTGMSTEELLASRRRANAKNRIPVLHDDAFEISRIEVMGFPVLKMFYKKAFQSKKPLQDLGRAVAGVRAVQDGGKILLIGQKPLLPHKQY